MRFPWPRHCRCCCARRCAGRLVQERNSHLKGRAVLLSRRQVALQSRLLRNKISVRRAASRITKTPPTSARLTPWDPKSQTSLPSAASPPRAASCRASATRLSQPSWLLSRYICPLLHLTLLLMLTQLASQYKDYFQHPNPITQGGIVAALPGGCLLGSLLSSCTGDYFGRRDSLALGCIIFIAGSCIMAAAQNREMLIAARVVNGIGVGMMTGQGYAIALPLLSNACANQTDQFTLLR